MNESRRVILYSRDTLQWSARVWWMLHGIGLDNISILGGDFNTWVAESHRITPAPSEYSPSSLKLGQPRQVFVGKTEVTAAINDEHVCLSNALNADGHPGVDARYGRRGHIPGSVNVPAASLQE